MGTKLVRENALEHYSKRIYSFYVTEQQRVYAESFVEGALGYPLESRNNFAKKAYARGQEHSRKMSQLTPVSQP